MSLSRPIASDSPAPARGPAVSAAVREPVFWRVEGSLLNLTAVRPVAFFTWNAQSFLGRWARRGAMGILALARPFLYCADRVFATRVLHMVLRRQSRDRLDLLGEEFFDYFLKPRLKQAGVAKLQEADRLGRGCGSRQPGPRPDHAAARRASGRRANPLRNRLDFRDGIATGRLLDPVIRPRGPFAKLREDQPDGTVAKAQLLRDLGFAKRPETLEETIRPARRPSPMASVPVVHFDSRNKDAILSVRGALRGKHVLLIGGTGFIGKVWLANLLTELPEIGRVYLLIREHRSATALERFRARCIRVAGFRAAGRTARRQVRGFSARASRGAERGREQAGPWPRA